MPGAQITAVQDLVRHAQGVRSLTWTTPPVAVATETLSVRPHLVRSSFDIDVLRRLGPLVVRPGASAGVPRAQVGVPVTPAGEVSDTVLYEDPTDPAKRYWLPRYRLRSTGGRYEILLTPVGEEWSVTFGLEAFPAPEIADAATTASTLPHTLTMTVTSGAGVTRSYPVSETTQDAGGWTLGLRMRLEERDALLRAFLSDAEQARIEVARAVTVAVPVPAGFTSPPIFVPIDLPVRLLPIDPLPVHAAVVPDPGVLLPQLSTDLLAGTTAVFAASAASASLVSRAGLVAREADAPQVLRRVRDHRSEGPVIRDHRSGGPIIRDHRTRRPDLPDPIEPEPVPEPVPDPVPQPEPPAEQLFTTTSTSLPTTVPLRFDEAAHPYLFPSGRTGPAAREFVPVPLTWPPDGPGARTHLYYQDVARGNVFHYLPDVFLVGQLPDPPHGPELRFTVGRASDDAGGAPLAVMDAHLVPQTSGRRLFAAQQQLAAHIPGGAAVDRVPQLVPLTPKETPECRLELPGGAVVTAGTPDLVHGWWVTQTFGYDGLQDVYAVLVAGGSASALLRGQVTVEIDGTRHPVDVEVRLDRLAAAPLSWVETPDPSTGQVAVTLRNESSGPVRVPRLDAWVARGTQVVPATVTGATLPAELTTGGELAVTIVPAAALPTDGVPDAALDTTAVRRVVDAATAVEQTLDPRVARLPRPIRVETTLGALGHLGDPANAVDKVGVEFKAGPVVTLDATQLQVEVLVPVPLPDRLLGRGQGTYQWRQTLFPRSGAPVSDTEWRTSDLGLLPVPVR